MLQNATLLTISYTAVSVQYSRHFRQQRTHIRDFLQSASRLSTLHSRKHHARPLICHRRFLVQSDCVTIKGSKEKRKARPSTWNWEGLRCLDSEFFVLPVSKHEQIDMAASRSEIGQVDSSRRGLTCQRGRRHGADSEPILCRHFYRPAIY